MQLIICLVEGLGRSWIERRKHDEEKRRRDEEERVRRAREIELERKRQKLRDQQDAEGSQRGQG